MNATTFNQSPLRGALLRWLGWSAAALVVAAYAALAYLEPARARTISPVDSRPDMRDGCFYRHGGRWSSFVDLPCLTPKERASVLDEEPTASAAAKLALADAARQRDLERNAAEEARYRDDWGSIGRRVARLLGLPQ